MHPPMLNRGRQALGQLTSFINLLARGGVPELMRPALAGARLIPLRESDGAPRPIAVSEVVRRLASKCFTHLIFGETSSHLKQQQLGVGAQRGAEAIVYGINAPVSKRGKSGSCGLLKIDLTNAFNVVNRDVIISKCRQALLKTSTWVETRYCAPGRLTRQEITIEGRHGAQQGDPLGPFLLALALQDLTTLVTDQLPDLLRQMWHLDDGIFIGAAEDLISAVHILNAGGPAIGLDLGSYPLRWPTISQMHYHLPTPASLNTEPEKPTLGPQ
eukprot:Plantae.Rhodophyta-Hildenbrandia_rubra.ctg21575.p1 GENE.Plantae.Rhodophyta-Hildenbrandia_rubra.ctg21575~~Plantae.Rhodophyta-Hildenbrandia_rubra.ctg21575.p1  ORF type:complete len:272 (-),score=-1.70 Plantae.Rhodophyta-Hildenbrandia_rubra.ctg21575:439-1254(-)